MADLLHLSQPSRSILLEVAARSIQHALEHHSSLNVRAADYPEELQACQAAFVTLHVDHCLRGCIGTLDANSPLIETVSRYAYSSAFQDQRFSSICRNELPRLQVTISVLSPLRPVEYASEEELVGKLRPGLDGVLLEEDGYRSTLLPSVWEEIPEPHEFLRRLKIKAGLPPGYWSKTIRFSLYETLSFSNMS